MAHILSRRLRPSAEASARPTAEVIERHVGRATKSLRHDLRELRAEHRELSKQLAVLHAIIAANSAGLATRYAGAMDTATVVNHVRGAIDRAALESSPTPHMQIEDLLPPLTYEALLAATPPDECFSQRDPVKQNVRPTRERLIPDFTGAMWRFIEEDVIAGLMVPRLVARFRSSIDDVYARRHGDRASAVAALQHRASAGRLMLRRPGYHLEPHMDPGRVILTCLLYLARPGDSSAFGTQLFSLDKTPTITGSKTYYPGEFGILSTLAKTVAFLPNTALVFLNAGAAAHGATIPADAPAGTKRYAYQFYIAPAPAELAAITGEPDGDEGT